MSAQYFAGFETGDLSEVVTSAGTVVATSSSPISGGYSVKLDTAAGGAYSFFEIGPTFNLSTSYHRYRISAHVTTNPGTDQTWNLIHVTDSSDSSIALVGMTVTAGGVIQVYCRTGDPLGANFAGPTATTISADTAYLIEVKIVISATVGVLEWKLNGVAMGTLTNTNTGSNNVARSYNGVSMVTGSMYCLFDDVFIDNANYPGPGLCIKVQGKTGTPNVDAFTKTGAATAALCWSTTPYATAANCNSSTSGAGQTMLCAASGLTIQQINACKVVMIAKTAVASSHSIRRRLASTNTDLAKSLTTADAYYDSAIFTDTIANLNTAEIGMLHGANANLTTVEDMWLMIDYTDASLIVEPIMQAVMQAANW